MLYFFNKIAQTNENSEDINYMCIFVCMYLDYAWIIYNISLNSRYLYLDLNFNSRRVFNRYEYLTVNL